MLVNSDTAVSIVHSVFLVGRCGCHMKRMCVSYFLLAGGKRQRYFKGEIYPPKQNLRDAITGKQNMHDAFHPIW